MPTAKVHGHPKIARHPKQFEKRSYLLISPSSLDDARILIIAMTKQRVAMDENRADKAKGVCPGSGKGHVLPGYSR